MLKASTGSVHAEVHRTLTRDAIALISNSGLTSILGVVYWLVAAHIMSRTDLGRGSALLSALWTVSALAQLNYARALPGLLPMARGKATRLLAKIYTQVVILSVGAGLAFAIVAPMVSSKFGYISGIPSFAPLFALSIPIYSIFTLEDSVLATVRRAVIVPFENAIYGVLKIVVLFIPALFHIMPASVVMLASWILPLPFIVLPLNIYLFKRGVPQATITFPKEAPPEEGKWARYDFLGYLFWLLGTLPLPVVAVTVLGPTRAAAFAVPFTIITAIDVMSLNLGNQLTAEMSRTSGEFRVPTIRFVWRAWGVIAALSFGLIVMAPYVLSLFGSEYRSDGTIVFQVMMLAALPRSILFFSIAATRARGVASKSQASGPIILVLQATTCSLTLAISLFAMHFEGILGIAFGWSIASMIGATMAIITVRPLPLLMMAVGNGRHRGNFQMRSDLLRVGRRAEPQHRYFGENEGDRLAHSQSRVYEYSATGDEPL
jgi:O-antigen/teichoic acid export membrane protein